MVAKFDNPDCQPQKRQTSRRRRPVSLEKARIVGFQYIPRPDGVNAIDKVFMVRMTGDSLAEAGIKK